MWPGGGEDRCALVRVSDTEVQVNRFERTTALHHNPDRLQERVQRSLLKLERTKAKCHLRMNQTLCSAQKDLGTKGWTWATGVSLTATKANSLSSCVNRSIAKRSRERTIPFYSSLNRQHLEYCSADRAERVSTGSPGHAVPALWNESARTGLPLPREGTALRDPNSCQLVSERCWSKRQSRVLYRVHSGSTGGNNLGMMKVSIRHREEKIIMRVLKEASQRGCEICILGGLQDPAG